VDDFGGDASSGIQDEIQSDEGAAARGAEPIQDNVSEQELSVSLPKKSDKGKPPVVR